ncbi:electron transfer flavoprotein subunit alpha/FixB family protein [Thiorhodococcus mannitoliphagus]|uniref:Electron transfer flavoprotein subunit alpha/FixB family protein n=1 Tax=Thiorhodococcus mannitoliphagus TaxID=329406 RepID=A0A6P1DS91_9GAMM|nr:electron transfer flavoprotein subunit alpha/FixB family protein [Thiorhodococcus mannitoliphagus]NEX20043.1 electron transfer flavoprotein subunit alpha/FixB family protein [Thiorhodococcus mannitoliphagus]
MTDKKQEVWVFIEQREGKPADVSFELLSKGRKLAESLKGELKAVVIGHDLQDLAVETFRYGATEALLVDHPELEHYSTLPYSRIMSQLVDAHQPRIVLFGASFIGRDLAPRVASHTLSGLTADCTDLQISDVTYLRKDYPELLLQIRPAFGGNIIATIICPDSEVQMATVREGVMEKIPLAQPIDGTVTQVSYTPDEVDHLVRIIERHHEDAKVNLKAAPIIVSGGYGMGNFQNFQILYDLAHVIGGEVAGTRAAVDAGFIDHERQVGQTGVTVRPKLYIACGISGAIQHRAGMSDSNKIIAINDDPEAPIFSVCHYGIVGDVMEVIPMLIDAYKHKLK